MILRHGRKPDEGGITLVYSILQLRKLIEQHNKQFLKHQEL